MQLENLEGIVLKKTLYQDHKMIVNFFSLSHGLITLSVPVSKKKAAHLGMFETGNLLSVDVSEDKEHFKFKEAYVLFAPHAIRSSLEAMGAFLKLFSFLNQLLEKQLAAPPFYKLVKNSLHFFEKASCKESLTYFVLLKWMQFEGILPSPDNPTINSEIKKTLSIRSFEQIFPFSEEFKKFIIFNLENSKF